MYWCTHKQVVTRHVIQIYFWGDTVYSCSVAKVISFFGKEYTQPLLVLGSTTVRMSSIGIVWIFWGSGYLNEFNGPCEITKLFTSWKKAIELKSPWKSDTYIQASHGVLAGEGALQGGSVTQELQNVGNQERRKNREAINSLIHCTHFLAHQHIPHTSNSNSIVDLVVSYGGKDLKYSLENAGRSTMYTSP